jgi:hypothetical protein
MIGLFLNMGIAKGLVNTIKYHMNAIIDSLDTNVIVFDANRGNKLKKLLNRDDVEYKHIPWIDGYTWKDYEKDIKDKVKDIDTLIIFGSTMFDTYNSKNSSLVDNFDKKLDEGNYEYNLSFLSTRIVQQRYFICKLCRDKKLIYVCLDPQECILTDKFNTGLCTYILNRGNKKYIPSYEKYMFKNGKDIEKTVDFTFYGTALTEDRKYLVDRADLLTSIRNSDVGIIVKKDNTYVSQTEYYDKLARSKFTLIIPSYDITTFSIIRFLEAVSNHCLPLVLDTVDLTDLKNTFPDIYDIVKKNLVVNIKDIQSKINELDYDKIIKKIFNTESVKNFTDLDYFKREWSKIV